MEKKDSQIVRRVFKSNYIVIVVASYIAVSGMIVDSILISRFMNETAISAYGVVMTVFIILSSLGGILSAGGQSVIGRELGIGEVEKANRMNSIINAATLAFAFILILLALVFQKTTLALLGATEATGELYTMSREYLLGLIIGFPAILWTMIPGSFITLDSDGARTFISTIVMTVVNIAGDLLNVFVIHGGMFGMALATSVSYYVGMLLVLPHFFDRRFTLKFTNPGRSLKPLLGVIREGIPTGACRLAAALKFAGVNRILLSIATATTVASFTVARSLINFYDPLTMAVGMVVLMMGSAFVGEEDRHTLELLLRTMLRYCMGPILIVTVVMMVFSKQLTGLFLPETSPAFADALFCNRCLFVCVPLTGINYGMANYLQSVGKLKASMICNVLDNGGLLLLCAPIMSAAMGVAGVFLAFPVSKLLVTLGLILYAWIFRKEMPRSIGDFLFLDKGFGVSESDEVRRTLTRQEEVIACSEDVRQFCTNRKLPKRTAMLLALCVEEMCGNIIQHGFEPNKENTIDVRLQCKEDRVTLRVRDDCKPFDPKKCYEIYKSKENFSNFGIKMVVGMTKEIRYVNLMNMNILYMEV